MATFTLTIQLGNAAMETSDDVAEALRRVADKMERNGFDGRIVDLNGNTVGKYEAED